MRFVPVYFPTQVLIAFCFVLTSALPTTTHAKQAMCQNIFMPDTQLWAANGQFGLNWDGRKWTTIKKSQWLQKLGIDHTGKVRNFQKQIDIATQVILEELKKSEIEFEVLPAKKYTLYPPSRLGFPYVAQISKIRIKGKGDAWINRIARHYGREYSTLVVIDPSLTTNATGSAAYASQIPRAVFIPFHEAIDPKRYRTANLSHELLHVRRSADHVDAIAELVKDPTFIPAIGFHTKPVKFLKGLRTDYFRLDEVLAYPTSLRITPSASELTFVRQILSFFKANYPNMLAALETNLQEQEIEAPVLNENGKFQFDQDGKVVRALTKAAPISFKFQTTRGKTWEAKFPIELLKPTKDLEERRADMRALLELALKIADRTIDSIGLSDPK